MSAKRFLLIFLFIAMLSAFRGAAAAPPPQYSSSVRMGRGGQQGYSGGQTHEDATTIVRQLRTGMSEVKNELSNHEMEIRTFEEKLKTQEQLMDDLQQQVKDDLALQRESIKAGSTTMQGKIELLDRSLKASDQLAKGTMTDLRQLKEQSDDAVKVLAQYKQKLVDLEKVIETQNHQIENFETALNAVIEVLKGKEGGKESKASTGGAKSYKVQSGDSLEKIARKQGVTVQALRRANDLSNSNDKIIIGQTLKIP